MMSINIDDPYITRIGVFAMFSIGLIGSSVKLLALVYGVVYKYA